MFNQINNAIEVDDSTKEIIDNSVVDNPGYDDGIWPLKGEILSGDEELVNVNRGWTFIKG